MTNETKIVELSEKAQKQVTSLLTKESKDTETYGLRLAIKGGGCSGLSYDLSFGETKDKDIVQEQDGFKVFIDPKSAIYLKGMTVDFDDGLMGKGFVFKNPNATNTCGCGESFSAF
jgi:iron-sulfur cluster assembly protein